MLAQIEVLEKYDQIPIVLGMILTLGLLIAFLYIYDKFLRKAPVLNLDGLQALEITSKMLEKLESTSVDGVEVGRRWSDLQHNIKNAVNMQENSGLVEALTQLSKVSEEIRDKMEGFYKAQGEREEARLKLDREKYIKGHDLQQELNTQMVKIMSDIHKSSS